MEHYYVVVKNTEITRSALEATGFKVSAPIKVEHPTEDLRIVKICDEYHDHFVGHKKYTREALLLVLDGIDQVPDVGTILYL